MSKGTNRKGRSIALIVALVLGFFLLIFLGTLYLLWDIYSTYSRMMSGT